jgi:hypothetical protein
MESCLRWSVGQHRRWTFTLALMRLELRTKIPGVFEADGLVLVVCFEAASRETTSTKPTGHSAVIMMHPSRSISRTPSCSVGGPEGA